MAKKDYSKTRFYTDFSRRLPSASWIKILFLILAIGIYLFFGYNLFVPTKTQSDSFHSLTAYGETSRKVKEEDGSDYSKDGKETVPISGGGAIVMDAKNGNVLYDFNGEKEFYPASCTKILSAIVALEEGNLKDKITVSENAVYNIDYDSSHIALDVGERVTLKDALYGMLLTSGNDCSVIVAEHIGGSVDTYSDMMNKKAEEIGCTHSHFTNPHGLYNKDHYSTPLDMARIMRYCIGNDEFVKISSTLKYKVPKTNKTEARELWNNHRMLKDKGNYYKPVVCGKSGYITRSKFNLITYGKEKGMELIVVIMEEDSPTTICEDTQSLMEYYFNNHKALSLPSSFAGIKAVSVDGKDVPITMNDDFQLIVPKGKKNIREEIQYETSLLSLKLPVEKGTLLGTVQAVYNGKVLGVIPIYAKESTTAFSPWWIIAIALLVAVVIISLIRLSFLKKRRRSVTFSRRRRKSYARSGRRKDRLFYESRSPSRYNR